MEKKFCFPKLIKFLSDYLNQIGREIYTVKFLETVNAQFSSADSVITNGKLEFAVNLYEKNCNITSNAQLAKVRSVLAAYLRSPFDLYNQYDINNSLNAGTTANLLKPKVQVNLPGLKAAQQTKAKKYLDDIAKLNIPFQKPPAKIGGEHAKWFVDHVNMELENDLKYHFALVSLNAAALSSAGEIINDSRFRASAIDPRWNEYDDTTKQEVAFYNQKFADVAGFVPLDWRYVKAMVWTEVLAGPAGNSKEWQQRPMQIGVGSDPSLGVVSSEKDDADLIVPEDRRNEIRSNHFGHNNIKAGIAALYYKAIEGTNAKTDPRKVASHSVIDNTQILIDTVQKGEIGFERIANRLGTTTDNLKMNNPEVDSTKLQVGQEIKYQRAHLERYITDWRDWQTTIKNYNKNAASTSKGGDVNYMDKVQRAYQIIISRTPQ